MRSTRRLGFAIAGIGSTISAGSLTSGNDIRYAPS
jgi:hypothetical protein